MRAYPLVPSESALLAAYTEWDGSAIRRILEVSVQALPRRDEPHSVWRASGRVAQYRTARCAEPAGRHPGKRARPQAATCRASDQERSRNWPARTELLRVLPTPAEGARRANRTDR